MNEKFQRSSYCRPVGPWLKWLFYACQLLVAIGMLALAVLFINIFPSFIHPLINCLLFAVAELSILGTCWSLFVDTSHYQSKVGLEFDEDFLYIFRPVNKVKVHYDDIKLVTFFPVLFTGAWLKIKTKKRSYIVGVRRRSHVAKEFEELDIPMKTDKFLMPLSLGTFILLGFFKPKAQAFILLLTFIFGFWSKLGGFSRRSEILVPISGLGLACILLVSRPWSKDDKFFDRLRIAMKSKNYTEASWLCSEVKDSGAHKILNYCAWFYITAPDQSLRNYQRGIQLALPAVDSAPNQKLKSLYADTLACGYMATGNIGTAQKLAKEYNLTSRTSEFANGKLCTD